LAVVVVALHLVLEARPNRSVVTLRLLGRLWLVAASVTGLIVLSARLLPRRQHNSFLRLLFSLSRRRLRLRLYRLLRLRRLIWRLRRPVRPRRLRLTAPLVAVRLRF
jgi:hypothetical protein